MSACLDLGGRSVLITGAAGGIGHACAMTLATANARLALSDLDGARLEQTVADARSRGATAEAFTADVTDQGACAALVAGAQAAFGGLYGLVAAAGIMQTKPLLRLTATDWRRMVDVNLSGTFFVIQAAARAMLAAGGGAIVIVASVAARSARPDAAHYAAAKTGLLSLTKSAATSFAPTVRVNAICPGVIPTAMWGGIVSDRNREFGAHAGEQFEDDVKARIPLARLGEPAEVAAVAQFLLSDAASYIHGQAINVDGGLEMT